MKTIAYINPDCFLDTDMSVLPELSKEYDILWIPILDGSGKGRPESSLSEFAAEHGIRIQTRTNTFRQRSLKNLSFYAQIFRVVKKEHCDMVYSAIVSPFWTITAALLLKIPIVRGIHDFEHHSKANKRRFLSLFTHLDIILNQYFVFFSKTQLNLFRKKFPEKKAICVGMATPFFGEAKATPPPFSDGISLLFFGRIDSYKGLDLLIEALENLYAQGIDKFHLSIKGNGSFWPECEKSIKHPFLFDPDIRFIRDDEIPDLFSSCHFLVLPYRDTTQSGPLMISLRYGIPVIAPALPSFMEYCTVGNSLLYQPGELTDALKRCAAMDEKTYQILRENWYTVHDCCTPHAIASNYIRFFHEIL